LNGKKRGILSHFKTILKSDKKSLTSCGKKGGKEKKERKENELYLVSRIEKVIILEPVR
jgi:hypothetical protein